jgi:hypothetical protein
LQSGREQNKKICWLKTSGVRLAEIRESLARQSVIMSRDCREKIVESAALI